MAVNIFLSDYLKQNIPDFQEPMDEDHLIVVSAEDAKGVRTVTVETMDDEPRVTFRGRIRIPSNAYPPWIDAAHHERIDAWRESGRGRIADLSFHRADLPYLCGVMPCWIELGDTTFRLDDDYEDWE